MHGYESVVGPVKGILAKENMMKPREHSLLVKERPSFVTILTLGMCTSNITMITVTPGPCVWCCRYDKASARVYLVH